MSEPFDAFPTCPPIPTGGDHTNVDSSATANTPISDFRRNEARPIVSDDYRHKSIYHQPSLTTYGPNERRRKRHRRSRQPIGQNDSSFKPVTSDGTNDSEPQSPGARVQFLLGDEDQEFDDEEHKPHDLFIELNELVADREKLNESGEPVDHGWKETARWVKFEEDVESGGRWSKPHVATLSLHSLLELRNFISKGSIILDMHADQLPVIADMILDDLIANDLLTADKRFIVRNALLLKHVHQHEKEFHRQLHSQEIKKPLPFTRSLAEFSRNRSQKDVTAPNPEQAALTSTASSSVLATNPSQSPTHTVKCKT
ncbi:unnamed protein product [Rotaria socialis]|uniref:Band 3 cytoplasmic domain-containing protein n=1 Tax=Rotaria socialis TaxID=392032 RepID=A0A817T290_9BILA|nr:unnamed protein product [Rotaria socialis]